jgi:hypothetical protein
LNIAKPGADNQQSSKYGNTPAQ